MNLGSWGLEVHVSLCSGGADPSPTHYDFGTCGDNFALRLGMARGDSPGSKHVVPMTIFVDRSSPFAYNSQMYDRGAASAGRPGKVSNPVDCGLPFGSQLPRPLVD
jgi:hypothetical protein